jgi:hypothetical protein
MNATATGAVRADAQTFAALAILIASGTAAAGAWGGSGWHLYGAGAYVAVTVLALFAPAAITLQVIGGQVLIAGLLFAPGDASPLLLVPLVIAVVATAELLALVARLRTSVDRDPRPDLRRAGIGALLAGSAFGIVVTVGALPGPAGLLSVALASIACVMLAATLISQ